MPRLLETIRCQDGVCLNLSYHLRRMNTSLKKLGYNTLLNLELSLNPPSKGTYKCRILYEKEIFNIDYTPYKMKKIQSFKCVHSSINYDLKYEDRKELNTLSAQKEEADEIIIIKNGLVTDTSIANLAFYDGKQWLTPKTPLLYGTCRQRLIDEKQLIPTDILEKDINNYSKIAIMNAMTDFVIIENAIIS